MKRSLLIILLIILIDLAGIFYGYYYYADQLSSSPLYLWIFIPDCPFYLMLFTIALVFAIFGFESRLFSYISAVGMMTYGVWTLLALLVFGDYFFAGSAWVLSSVLFVLHIGMFAEGFLLIPKKVERKYLFLGLGWFLLNDYVDYFYGYVNNAGEYIMGTHPDLPPLGRIPIMMLLTVLLSIVMCLFAYGWSFGDMSWPARKELEDVKRQFQKALKSTTGRRRSSR
jgi:uncharacterized membrane protein YpjA